MKTLGHKSVSPRKEFRKAAKIRKQEAKDEICLLSDKGWQEAFLNKGINHDKRRIDMREIKKDRNMDLHKANMARWSIR